jgi:hypothetical protein
LANYNLVEEEKTWITRLNVTDALIQAIHAVDDSLTVESLNLEPIIDSLDFSIQVEHICIHTNPSTSLLTTLARNSVPE